MTHSLHFIRHPKFPVELDGLMNSETIGSHSCPQVRTFGV